jgi:hypothetical protein
MLKSFFSRFASEQSAPRAANDDTSGAAKEPDPDFIQQMKERAAAYPRPEKEPPPRVHYDHPRERDEVPAEFKFATYREGNRYTRVAYAVFHGNRCVFIRADRPGGSTSQNEEYVAKVIARRERRPLESLRFYCLEITNARRLGNAEGVGETQFEEIILACDDAHTRHVYAKGWIDTECPDYVTELFRGYVADNRPRPASESASKDF